MLPVLRFRWTFGIERYLINTEIVCLQDVFTDLDMDEYFRQISSCDGKVLAVLTNHSIDHYNQQSQFVCAMNYVGFCASWRQIQWFLTDCQYPVQNHRDRPVH